MQPSQTHLISILQEQLIESRETEKNLRRVNDSLVLALQTQTQTSQQCLQVSTIRQIERKWEQEARRRIKENEEYWNNKLNRQIERRKEAEKKLGIKSMRLQRSISEESSTNIKRLRENKMRHIQGLMDQIIHQKVSSRKASVDRSNGQRQTGSANKKGQKYKSVCESVTPLGCISQMSNYQNTLKLKIRTGKGSINEGCENSQPQTERCRIKTKLTDFKTSSVKNARTARRNVE